MTIDKFSVKDCDLEYTRETVDLLIKSALGQRTGELKDDFCERRLVGGLLLLEEQIEIKNRARAEAEAKTIELQRDEKK
ncbi:unnamed protein product [Toxocara canis]|uniref:Phage protein n=1 Tax=Toxocara canis TaxID=6265 RepID=A0A183UIP8_TOXCA|nr:unnamed protein product [Toxocara canis]